MKKSDNNRNSMGQKNEVIIPVPATLIEMPKGYESF